MIRHPSADPRWKIMFGSDPRSEGDPSEPGGHTTAPPGRLDKWELDRGRRGLKTGPDAPRKALVPWRYETHALEPKISEP